MGVGRENGGYDDDDYAPYKQPVPIRLISNTLMVNNPFITCVCVETACDTHDLIKDISSSI